MPDDFHIYIPSSSRPTRQKTIENLHPELWPYISIITPREQVFEYYKNTPPGVRVYAFDELGISKKRQHILTLNTTGKIIMMDDDLRFYKRIEDGGFKPAATYATIQMITDIAGLLDTYPYVGLVDKFFSDTRPRGFVECTRFNQVLAVNRDLLPDPWPSFRPAIHEEHDFHLQFLTRGMKTAVTTEWTKTDTHNAPGGCSEWRNTELMIKASNQMLEHWPGLVSVTNKEPYGAHLKYNWRGACRAGGL
jgi:hypothetical protein